MMTISHSDVLICHRERGPGRREAARVRPIRPRSFRITTSSPAPWGPSPAIPPPSSPASRTDAEYERWLVAFVEQANDRHVDRNVSPTGEILVGKELVRTYQLTAHLFKFLNGWAAYPPGTGPTFLHRLRFVAVQFQFRRDELVAEAERYEAELAGGPS
jgi:hypothetical protein